MSSPAAEAAGVFASTSWLHPVGHDDLCRALADAHGRGRMPQALLLHGPPGVGKRALALWTAAMLQCGSEAAPCGGCRSCRLSSRLEHPDTHFHFPLPRPKSGPRKKMRDRLERSRFERMEQLRESGSLDGDADEVTGIYLAAVEEVRAQAARRPSTGDTSVFVIAEAERMVPQSANQEAANAFLKLLEEPPAYGQVILTSSMPDALLPTIRSRLTALRVPPIPLATLGLHLQAVRQLAPADAERLARRAQGSPGRALQLAEEEGTESDRLASGLLAAALIGDEADRLLAAARFTARGARSILSDTLDVMEHRLRDLMCVTVGAAESAADRERAARALSRVQAHPDALQRALSRVADAKNAASRNFNPQVTIALLLDGVARDVHGRGT